MDGKRNPAEQIQLFGMRNLLLESELAKIEAVGIEIGHAKTIQQDPLVDLELFDRDIRLEAKRMADFYVLYYCLENTVRRLISERLREKHGANWWEVAVPAGIKAAMVDKQDREKDTVLAVRSEDPLSYVNFGELIGIIEANWTSFSDTIRSKKAMQQTLLQFNQIRNVIAHSSSLSTNDISRLKLLVNDWLNIQT